LYCPCCDKGVLGIIEDTFIHKSTKKSADDMEITGDVSCLDIKFFTFLECSNNRCKEIVVMGGIGKVEEEYESSEEQYMGTSCISSYEIKYIDPPINIIKISDEVPSCITDTIKDSFSLFWGYPSLVGNRIRTALELILNEKNVKSTGVNKNGKEYRMSLHERIKEFGKIKNGEYKELQKMLLGIKWLGNVATHGEEMKKEDLLNAYEVLDCILDEIFVRDKKLLGVKEMSHDLEKSFKLER